MLRTFKAIKSKWLANTTLAAVGTPWLGSCPETLQNTFPRVFVDGMGEKPDEAFGLMYIDRMQITLNVINTDVSAIASTIKTIKQVFDRSTLTIDDGTSLSCIRIAEGVYPYEGATTDQLSVHRGWVRYRVQVNRSF